MPNLIQLHPSFESFPAAGGARALRVRLHAPAELSVYLKQLGDADTRAVSAADRSPRWGAAAVGWARRTFSLVWPLPAGAARRGGAPGWPEGHRSGLGSRPSSAGDTAGGEAVGTAPDCATLYCARNAIRPHQFVDVVFWRTLFPWARWLGFPLIVLFPRAFARDREFLAAVGLVRSLDQYAVVEEGFHRWREPQSLLRGVLRLRVSKRRLRRLVEGVLARPGQPGGLHPIPPGGGRAYLPARERTAAP